MRSGRPEDLVVSKNPPHLAKNVLIDETFFTTLTVVTMANLIKCPGLEMKTTSWNKGGDTELTDDRGSHDDPNLKSSVAICGRSNSHGGDRRLEART